MTRGSFAKPEEESRGVDDGSKLGGADMLGGGVDCIVNDIGDCTGLPGDGVDELPVVAGDVGGDLRPRVRGLQWSVVNARGVDRRELSVDGHWRVVLLAALPHENGADNETGDA